MKMAAFAVAIALAALLAESQAREARAKDVDADTKARWSEIAANLRAPFHPKQRAFATSRELRRAAKCTRRAGKTNCIGRESLARALERRFRFVYCHATRAEAHRLIWRGDTRDGWRDLVEDCGLRVAHTRAEFSKDRSTDCLVNESDLTIEFRNGSQLAVFCADRAADADKLRGGEKDAVCVDEAQQFPDLLYFVEQVAEPLLAKPHGQQGGELWLTGTPSQNLAGLFFEVTREADQGERKVGWDVHEFAVTDNPYFGATPEERWAATAGAELARKGWSLDNPPPQFVREWLGRWTKGDALYVYAVHAAKPEEFAPVRVNDEGAYDHAAALADLPVFTLDDRGRRDPIEWYFTMGVDFGFRPDPFAWVLEAWSPQVEDVYEMASWKRTLLMPEEMRKILVAVYDQVKTRLVAIRGDSGGAAASALIEEWQRVFRLPILPADKLGKEAWQELYNGELYAGRKHYRVGSALLGEQRELQWRMLPSGKRVEWADRTTTDGVKPGNHLCDADLYCVRDIAGRTTQFTPPPKSPEERDSLFQRDVLAKMDAAWRAQQGADEA